MSNAELKLFASSTIQSLFSSGKITLPISSLTLLTRVISSKRLVPPSPHRFRLTDLPKFEAILIELSHEWEYGVLSLATDESGVTVVDVYLDTAVNLEGYFGDAVGKRRKKEQRISRKRKRVVDEDADSAAGDAEGADDSVTLEEPSPGYAPHSTLGGLSKEMKEVYAVLQMSTAKSRLLAEQFHTVNEHFEPMCSHITKDECAKARNALSPAPKAMICDSVHFRPLIRAHTDQTLGHCSYLNTCYSEPTYAQSPSIPPFPGGQGDIRVPVSLPSGLGAGGRGKEKAPCRYLHFEVDWDGGDGESKPREQAIVKKPYKIGIGLGPDGPNSKVYPPQWINCDLRRFDYSVLGKFHVIMADPPWDIHMSLPYGTMTDDEMRAMPIPALQDEGLLFLWVTGRALEVGRECLRVWGYTRVDEVIWVKTNQLQRVIRTGRTGHWLNHTKEHMLVGCKTSSPTGIPHWANRGLDVDVIVSEVRETSRKPDEVYGLIERICPGGRKVEIFGRRHNTRPGWLTLGNQLGADQIFEEDLSARIRARYPERAINTGLPPNPLVRV